MIIAFPGDRAVIVPPDTEAMVGESDDHFTLWLSAFYGETVALITLLSPTVIVTESGLSDIPVKGFSG